MKSNILFAVYFSGLIISFNAAPPPATEDGSSSKTWTNLKYFLGKHTCDRPAKMPKCVTKLGSNISSYHLNKGSIKTRAWGDQFAFYEAAGLNAISLYKRKEDARKYLYDSLKSETLDKPKVYTAGILGSFFDGKPENVTKNINTVVEFFIADLESELAEKCKDL
ncbi:uncharacterized protein LOC126832767 [Adelges cooleyi]|uniref:uncharacterized protein LOC126832767 n=1 Tax=Adelges cooleyi TaxID=133065 RepID=UPI00217F9A20|nr:uncharacterized protein LOC126832767 [Adelges cooleyi]